MFLGLPDPDPLVRGMDPDQDPALDPSLSDSELDSDPRIRFCTKKSLIPNTAFNIDASRMLKSK
jgi:hypothetical protein